jgi:hypothetical protein
VPECAIMTRFHDPMHACDRDILASIPPRDPIFHQLDYIADLYGAHAHA